VQVAEQSLVKDGLGGDELARIASLEAYASFHAGIAHGYLDGPAIFLGKGQQLFDFQVLARKGTGHRAVFELVRVASNFEMIGKAKGYPYKIKCSRLSVNQAPGQCRAIFWRRKVTLRWS
jgi:hypothetical protein